LLNFTKFNLDFNYYLVLSNNRIWYLCSGPTQTNINVMNILGSSIFALFTLLLLFSNVNQASSSGIYSIRFSSSSIQAVQFTITINGLAGTPINTSVPVGSTNWINFDANPNDILSVNVNEFFQPFGLSYTIRNGADGSGIEIYDSKINTFTPVNTCPENDTCKMQVFESVLDGGTIDFYVNNILVLANFNGSEEEQFEVDSGDFIRAVFTYGGESTEVNYSFSIDDDENSWIYDSFGINTLISNPDLRRTPFGGLYSPITNEEISAFAVTIGAGNENTFWRELTE
jgi:hypothetical protein